MNSNRCRCRRQILSSLLFFLLATSSSVLRAQDLTLLEEQSIQSAVKDASAWIVRIETIGGLEVGGEAAGAGPTTGIVVSDDGFIISSTINFSRIPASILVTLPDGQRQAAKLIATDHSRKLVLLKVSTDSKLTPAPAVARSELRVGGWAIAVGRVYSPDSLNISTGIISATQRIWGRAVQTDAKISPANYGGALLDIQGRVIGVLTPMSPRGNDATAGSEWYDSGIGFAVPLEDVYARLKMLKKGDDLRAGILGVAFESQDIYSKPAKVAAVRAKSPARDAGLKPGDKVVEVNGKPIARLAQMKHALGPLYAGDQVSLIVERGEPVKRVPLKTTLVDKLVPYQHPFLGVLPQRDGQGIQVRYVYPDSPAAQAGVKAGDTLEEIGGETITDVSEAQQRLAAFEAGDSASLKYKRDGKSVSKDVTFAALPETPPAGLPAAREPSEEPYEGAKADSGQFEIRIPEESSSCTALAPDDYDPRIGHALFVILGRPGKQSPKELFDPWRTLVNKNQLILLGPKASDDRGWKPTDVDFVIKTIESVMQSHTVDPNRIVIMGEASGGAMGYLVCNKRRDLIRGLVTLSAPYPQRTQPPENEPLQRLAFFSFSGGDMRLKPRLDATLKMLRDAKFPVSEATAAGDKLSADDYQTIVRWSDALDRL